MIEYVMGETMEIYLAVLFLWLITGLIFLINIIGAIPHKKLSIKNL